MENDAISRNAVIDIIDEERSFIESLRETICDNEDRAHNTGELGCAIRLARKIKVLPAVDVAPVVHARWNEDDGTCSACCHEACYDEWTEPKWDYDWDENLVQTGEETHIQFIFSPYCPNCGARMDGDAECVKT